jgi:hypothetical protein
MGPQVYGVGSLTRGARDGRSDRSSPGADRRGLMTMRQAVAASVGARLRPADVPPLPCPGHHVRWRVETLPGDCQNGEMILRTLGASRHCSSGRARAIPGIVRPQALK